MSGLPRECPVPAALVLETFCTACDAITDRTIALKTGSFPAGQRWDFLECGKGCFGFETRPRLYADASSAG